MGRQHQHPCLYGPPCRDAVPSNGRKSALQSVGQAASQHLPALACLCHAILIERVTRSHKHHCLQEKHAVSGLPSACSSSARGAHCGQAAPSLRHMKATRRQAPPQPAASASCAERHCSMAAASWQQLPEARHVPLRRHGSGCRRGPAVLAAARSGGWSMGWRSRSTPAGSGGQVSEG